MLYRLKIVVFWILKIAWYCLFFTGIVLIIHAGFFYKIVYESENNRIRVYFQQHYISRKKKIALIILSVITIIVPLFLVGFHIKKYLIEKGISKTYIRDIVNTGAKY